jgi:hypothetical protein
MLKRASVLFPLEELTAWATKKGSPALAAEFERLAFARAVDLRPESVEKTLAKRLSQRYGERFTPHQILYGAVRDATPEETAAIRAANCAKLDHYGKQLFAELDFVEGLFVMYGLIPAL